MAIALQTIFENIKRNVIKNSQTEISQSTLYTNVSKNDYYNENSS